MDAILRKKVCWRHSEQRRAKVRELSWYRHNAVRFEYQTVNRYWIDTVKDARIVVEGTVRNDWAKVR